MHYDALKDKPAVSQGDFSNYSAPVFKLLNGIKHQSLTCSMLLTLVGLKL